MTDVIDLSQLPPPDAVETLSVEIIRDEILDALAEKDSTLADLEESDPAYAVVEVCAYRETLLRQRVNDAIRAILLGTSWGTNLDHLGTPEGVERASTVDETGETIEELDDVYRRRIQVEKQSRGAGVREAFEAAALGADSRVADAHAQSPSAAVAIVEWAPTVDADPDDYTEIGDAVTAAVTADDVRTLTDSVSATRATAVSWTVEAKLLLEPGPDPATALAAATASLVAFAAKIRKVRYPIRRDGIHAALRVTGVAGVDLTTPAADVSMVGAQFPEFDPDSVALTYEVASWLD